MKENESHNTVSKKWAEEITRSYKEKTSTPFVLIADIDDTILDSSLRWYQTYLLLNSINKGLFLNNLIPTRTEFKKNGPRSYFSEFVEDYDSFKNRLIKSNLFNQNLKGVETLESLKIANEKYKVPHGYISTRPEGLRRLTQSNIKKRLGNFAPIMLRSNALSYQNTISYKIQCLLGLKTQLNNVMDPIIIYYVDDYVDLIDELNKLNMPGLVGLVFDSNNSWREITEFIFSQ